MIRLAAMLVTLSSLSLTAAYQPSPVVQFEIASIKVNATGNANSYSTIAIPPSGRVSITNAELRHIITQAFQINPQIARFVLIGGSERIMRTRFDISAKPPDDAPPGQAPTMLRALLTKRFGLQVHPEKRHLPVYALKAASSRRFGPNFRPSRHNCDEFIKARRQGNGVVEPSDANGKSWCLSNPFARDGIALRGAGTIAQLIQGVQAFADRKVIDMTGLAGNFEWDVKFLSASASLGRGMIQGSDIPDMFTAFRDQLGLKLEPQIAPYEVLVIDRVEMPTPD